MDKLVSVGSRPHAPRGRRAAASLIAVTVALLGLPLVASPVQAAGTPALQTDKADYAPGETVTVSGSGFAPSTAHDLPVIRPNGSIVVGDGSFDDGWDSVMTDAAGDFTYAYQLNGVIGAYEVRAYLHPWNGDLSLAPLATHTFTDNPDHSAGDYFMFAKARATGVTTDRKANETNCDGSNDKQVDFSGSSSQVYGRMHSNADIAISGSNNTFHDTSSGNPEITYGTHDEDCQVQANLPNTYSSAPLPTSTWEIDTQAPGVDLVNLWPGNLGTFLNADQQTFPNQAHSVTAVANRRAAGMDCDTGSLTGSSTINISSAHAGQVVCNGSGEINISVSGLGTSAAPFAITMLSHGLINISGSNHHLVPAQHGVLAWTDKRFDQDALVIKVSGSNVNIPRRAILFAPRSGISVSGSNNATMCVHIVGQGSNLANGSNITFGPLAPGCTPTGSLELKKVWSGTAGQTTLNIGTTAGGSQIDTQLTGANGAPPLTTGANSVQPGTYFLSETGGLTGYTPALACVNNSTNPASNVTIGPSQSVVVASGNNIVCTFTNSRDQGSIELKKVWSGTAGQTTLNIGTTAGGSQIDTQLTGAGGAAPLTTGANGVDTGTYFLSEVGGLTDYSTTLVCVNNVDPLNPVPVTVGVDDSVVVGKDDVVECTYTNARIEGSIELKKVWSGTPGQTTLSIGTTLGGDEIDTQLTGANGAAPLTTGPNGVDAGTFFVSETGGLADYDATLSCVNQEDPLNPVPVTVGANDSVPVGADDVVVCTYTNTRKQGTIELTKVWNGTAGSTTLQIGTTAGGTDIDTEALAGTDGTTGPNPVDTGTYFVSETDPGPDYVTTLVCENLEDPLNPVTLVLGASDSVTVGEDDVVVCTFTNSRKRASIELTKVWSGPAGNTTLQIGTTAGGTEVDAEPLAGVDGTTGANPVDTGTYFVSETDPGANYDSALACVNNSDPLNPAPVAVGANNSVILDQGDVVMCTFTNTARADVQVVKTEGGAATTGQFTFTLTGGPGGGVNVTKTTNSGGEDDSLEFAGLVAGSYKLCETVPAGYSSDLGPDANGDPCEEFTLAPGDSKVINVDNTPCPAGTLTVRKNIPDVLQGAETETFLFDITGPGGFTDTISITFNAGDVQKTGSTTTPISGTYTVTEQANPPFAPNPPVNVDILHPACSAEVQLTNNFAPPIAQVNKITVPAGSEGGWVFTLRRNGVPVETQTTNPAGDAVFITALDEADWSIIETPQPGFVQVSASGCNFTVDLPADADRVFTCTVRNDELTSSTIIKSEKLPGKKLRAARGKWTFYIRGGPNNIALKATTNRGRIKNAVSFPALQAGTYTICEKRFKGWKSSLGGRAGFKAKNGDRCVTLTLAAGVPAVMRVVNTCTS